MSAAPGRAEPWRAPVMVDLRLLPCAIAAWAASWWAPTTSATPPGPRRLLIACALAGAAAACVLTRPRCPRPKHALTAPGSARLGAAIVCAAALGALATGWAAADSYNADPARAPGGGRTAVTARVRLVQDPAPARSRHAETTARARLLTVDGAPSGAYALLRGPGIADAARGDELDVVGTIDLSSYSEAPNAGVLRVKRASTPHRPGGVWAWARSVRAHLVRTCSAMSPQARALVPGMAIGDDRALPAGLEDAMRTTSLTHLTAVSGSHIVIVLAVVSLAVPGRRIPRALSTGAVLALILLLVGPEPSVVRSVATAAVSALALIAARPGQACAALCAVVTGTVIIDPWASRSYGFALSVLAALAVIGPAAAAVRWSARRLRGDTALGRALRRLVGAVAVPAACQVFVMPVLLILDPSVPTWAVLANALAEPAVAPATVAALSAALLGPYWQAGAAWCAWASSWATGWIAWVAQACADLPGARLEIPVPAVVGAYLVGAGAYAAVRARALRRGARR